MHSIIKKHFVELDGAAAPLAAGPMAAPAPTAPPSALPSAASRPSAAGRRCEKSARPITIEGAIRAIEVTCSCGETTVIELEYPHA